VVSIIDDVTINENSPYYHDFNSTFSIPEAGDSYSYSLSMVDGSDIPGWININSLTGVLSGQPGSTDVGIIDVKVTATDLTGQQASDVYRITVKDVVYGTTGDDELTVQAETISIIAGLGEDTVILPHDFTNYTFSQSDSFIPLLTHNETGQTIHLHSVEKLQFNDRIVDILPTDAGEFQVNTNAVSMQQGSSAASLHDDGFVVVWQLYDQNSENWSVYAQRYGYDGNSLGDEFKVNSNISISQPNPVVTSLSNNNHIITWQSYDGTTYVISGQLYNEDGVA